MSNQICVYHIISDMDPPITMSKQFTTTKVNNINLLIIVLLFVTSINILHE